MMGRLAWALYRLVRTIVLPRLSDRDRAEMDDLIRTRADAVSGRPLHAVGVWARELLDLFAASLRSSRGASGQRESGGGMGPWISDMRIAGRSLARRPGFALGAAATLALGIGATTTMFTVVDEVMLRPLPYDESEDLVTIGSYSRVSGWVAPSLTDLGQMSTRQYQHLRERATSFAALAAVDIDRLLPPSLGLGQRVVTHAFSAELLEMLGATTPAAGRTFLPEEYDLDRQRVMITYDGWQRRYGGDVDVVGQPIGTGPDRPTLIGVLPPDFRPLEAFSGTGVTPDFYYAGWADQGPPDRGWEPVFVLGRLKTGVTLEQARAEVEQLTTELSTDFPELVGASLPSGVGIGLNGLQAQTVGGSGQQLRLFLGAATLLLLLAAMNGGTLLLARSMDRGHELGIRVALGASRTRVVRLIMSEAAVLGILGGGLGVLLAYGGVGTFRRYAPASIARLSEVAIDGRVLAVAAATSVGTALFAGLLPTLRLSWGTLGKTFSRSGRSFTEGSRVRAVLAGGQMAVAIVLLSGAGLLFNSFVRMRAIDPGFAADGLIAISAPYKDAPSAAGLSDWQAWDVLLDELGALPGVESVAGATGVPFQSPNWTLAVQAPGALGIIDDRVAAYAITPTYLETMGTELVAGRGIERGDGADSERVALVNETFVQTFLDGGDPIDMVVRLTDLDQEVRIVGVTENVVQRRAEEGSRPAIYLSYSQYAPYAGLRALVRTMLPATVVAPRVRQVTAGFTGLNDQAVATMRDLMATSRADPRFQAVLVGAFALISALLAAVGLYGALAHYVGRRGREIGVRIALGAGRPGVLGMVIGHGIRISMAGLVLGMVSTLLVTRVLTGLLYGVEPNDPLTLLSAGGALVLVSAAACVLPAHRATTVDPVSVLNAE